jgi:hypothetical protein
VPDTAAAAPALPPPDKQQHQVTSYLMIHFSFTDLGYVYMLLIWLIAPAIGIYHARKKNLNPYFWGFMCFIIPLCVFAVVGIRAAGEPVPAMFREEDPAAQEDGQQAEPPSVPEKNGTASRS